VVLLGVTAWRAQMRGDVEESLSTSLPPAVGGGPEGGLVPLGWGFHNFELAFRRRNWRSGIEMRGIDALEPWAVISEENDFVARVPGTSVLVSGTLVAYEQLVIVERIEGTDS
jgi:hypothetical protein